MKKIITSLFALLLVFSVAAQDQTIEELKAMYDAKSGEAAALKAEADALKGKIDAFPGWKYGGQGIIGLDLAGNNNWFAISEAFSSQQSLGLGFDAFANLDKPKFFWRNNLGIAMKRLESKQISELDTSTVAITDALNIGSLAGYKLSDKIAISAEGTYASTVLNFNDPGQLTVSAGVTWTPIKDLVVIVHPLGYQITFPTASFNSAPGAKIGARYQRELIPGLAWTTDLAAFLSYGGGDNNFSDPVSEYSAGDLSNWTWTNGLNFTAWQGIGVGLKAGIRSDRQLADGYILGAGETRPEGDNPLQSYWNAGLSYGF